MVPWKWNAPRKQCRWWAQLSFIFCSSRIQYAHASRKKLYSAFFVRKINTNLYAVYPCWPAEFESFQNCRFAEKHAEFSEGKLVHWKCEMEINKSHRKHIGGLDLLRNSWTNKVDVFFSFANSSINFYSTVWWTQRKYIFIRFTFLQIVYVLTKIEWFPEPKFATLTIF